MRVITACPAESMSSPLRVIIVIEGLLNCSVFLVQGRLIIDMVLAITLAHPSEEEGGYLPLEAPR
jgi:hypothetical protein